MFNFIEIYASYNNLYGFFKDQSLTRRDLIKLIDTHPTFDDLDDNFVTLSSSDDVAIFQAKRVDTNEWTIDIAIKASENKYNSISCSIDHANLTDAMLNFFSKDQLFDLIYGKDIKKINNYLKNELFSW